jgi:lactoylglutathione lyase
MSQPSLNLLVIRVANIESAIAFYQTIGLEFIQEQHGNGPIHYSCEIGSTVLEIYPGKPGNAPPRTNAGSTMMGFQVVSLDEIVVVLQNKGTTILTAPQDSQWGRRAVVQDPDGRAVELSQLRISS